MSAWAHWKSPHDRDCHQHDLPGAEAHRRCSAKTTIAGAEVHNDSNLILEQLRSLREDIQQITTRLDRIEQRVDGTLRQLTGLAEAFALMIVEFCKRTKRR
jgi:hypothetical protein